MDHVVLGILAGTLIPIASASMMFLFANKYDPFSDFVTYLDIAYLITVVISVIYLLVVYYFEADADFAIGLSLGCAIGIIGLVPLAIAAYRANKIFRNDFTERR